MATALVISTLAPIGIWAQTISYSDLRNVGRAEYVAGRFAAAEDLLRRGLDRAVAAADRATAATIDNDLGAVYISEERLQDAEQAYARGLALFKQMRDKEFEVAAILRNLGCTYSLQRRYEEALKTLDQAERLPIIRAGGKDPKIQGLTAEIHNTKGIVHLRQGKLGKARDLFEQAIRARSAASIDGGLGDAATLSNIGSIYLRQRRYAQAEPLFLKSLELTARLLGPSHPDLTLTLPGLGQVYFQMGRYADSMAQYQRSLAILRAASPQLDGRIAQILHLASSNYLKRGDEAGAEQALTEAVELVRHTNVMDDPGVPDLLDDYATLLRQLGKTDKARQADSEAHRLRAATALTVRVPANRY
jgi:tetratricopeptide (TPR) repeat protein